MKLDKAHAIAHEWVAKLRPFCDRIEIAGSIRRQKAEVKDIEIVCIPKVVKSFDLFQNFTESRHPEFCELLRDSPEEGVVHMLGDPVRGKMVKLHLNFHNINIDLFTATENNWGHILAIRTGCADFSHRVLANAWVKAGYHSINGELTKDGNPIAVREEQDLFKIIGLAYVEPQNRVWP
jgi:DNA polymerase/3'-5' exonuclease PolX